MSDRWRVSENTIGVMVNPTGLSDVGFARDCYRYLLARGSGEPFDAAWLDDPRLYPKRLLRDADVKAVRGAIGDIRVMETVVYAEGMFGDSYVARLVQGRHWSELDWRTPDGEPTALEPAIDPMIGVITWRRFLDEAFLDHVVAFTLEADGRRSTGETVGILVPAAIQIIDVERTGKTAWAMGEAAEIFVAGDRWARTLRAIQGASETELRTHGIAPRSFRAWVRGQPPTKRNTAAAEALARRRATRSAGLVRDPSPPCLAPGCPELLTGRQRSFCTRHAKAPGSRRKAWREAGGT